jgi:hypothetical protein
VSEEASPQGDREGGLRMAGGRHGAVMRTRIQRSGEPLAARVIGLALILGSGGPTASHRLPAPDRGAPEQAAGLRDIPTGLVAGPSFGW